MTVGRSGGLEVKGDWELSEINTRAVGSLEGA
jgi:hypothetical protein